MPDDIGPLSSKPNISYKKERRLVAQERDIQTPFVPPPSQVAERVFDNLRTTSKKAQILYDSIEFASKDLTIPVRPEDIDVRAAVARKDPLSNGQYITFQLYVRSVQFEIDAFKVSPKELSEIIIGHPVSDSKHLQELALSKSAKISKEDARLMQSQAMYLYILQLMQMGLQAMESEKQTVGKTTGVVFGSEIPALTTSLLFSIAFQMAYSANLSNDIKLMMKEASVNALKPSQVDIEKSMDEATKIKLPDLRLINLALKSKDPEDYDLIRNYAKAFLKRTKKLGYEPWMFVEEVLRLKAELDGALEEEQRYGPNLPMSRDIEQVLDYQASQYSNAFDYIASSLRETFKPEKYLCSLKYLFSVSSVGDLVSILEAMMNMAITTLMANQNSMFMPEGSMNEPLIDKLIHETEEVLAKCKKKLLDWMDPKDDMLRMAIQCTPISDLVRSVTYVLTQLEQSLYSQIATKLTRMRDIVALIRAKSITVTELKRMKMVLDTVRYTEAKSVQVDDGMAVEEVSGFNPETNILSGPSAMMIRGDGQLFNAMDLHSDILGNIGQAGVLFDLNTNKTGWTNA